MKQVHDISGKKIQGLYETENGTFIVKDPVSLQKAQNEKEKAMKIKTLEEKVDSLASDMTEIKTILGQLMSYTRERNG